MDTFLFDLDGTLLPMDQDKFVDVYFKEITKKLVPLGCDYKTLISILWEGTTAMINNDGTMPNSERFWQTAGRILGNKISEYEKVFCDYYENEFQMLKDFTNPTPMAKECIRILQNKGYRIVLATNPVFPRTATYSRIRWAGLVPEDFALITTYENSSFCKPYVEYYEEILDYLGLVPEQCIMVGNDVSDDMSAGIIGMDTYLITDCLINTKNKDINCYKNGSLKDFYGYLKSLPSII
jgi:haloacid dehalogenase-like hydrolase.